MTTPTPKQLVKWKIDTLKVWSEQGRDHWVNMSGFDNYLAGYIRCKAEMLDHPAKLPAWRGICHPDGTRHLTQNICMNAHQLRNALDFVNPDGAKGSDQLESDLTINWRKEAVFEGENYPAGLYAHFSEYPEEGSIFLDTDKSTITHPAPKALVTADMVTDEMVEAIDAHLALGNQPNNKDFIAAAVNAYLGAKK